MPKWDRCKCGEFPSTKTSFERDVVKVKVYCKVCGRSVEAADCNEDLADHKATELWNKIE